MPTFYTCVNCVQCVNELSYSMPLLAARRRLLNFSVVRAINKRLPIRSCRSRDGVSTLATCVSTDSILENVVQWSSFRRWWTALDAASGAPVAYCWPVSKATPVSDPCVLQSSTLESHGWLYSSIVNALFHWALFSCLAALLLWLIGLVSSVLGCCFFAGTCPFLWQEWNEWASD